MPIPLSDVRIRAAKPATKPYKLTDGGGLYLHVMPSGSRYWRLKYRFGGTEKLLAVGRYPLMTLKEARNKRDEAKRHLAEGIDPSALRRAAKASKTNAQGNSVEAVARLWLAEVHAKDVVADHSARNLRRLELYIFPRIGVRPIAEITPPELLAELNRIMVQGKGDTAHRVKTLCGQIWRYAAARGLADRDITADLKDALPSVRGTHHPALTEPKALASLMKSIDQYGGSPTTIAALRLSALLFGRPGEIRQLRWSSINMDNWEWSYAPSKGGLPMLVTLPVQAREILLQMQSLSRGSEFTFPGARSIKRPMSSNAVRSALINMGYAGLMSAHGFRATARTILVERLGIPINVVEMQLAHTVSDPLGRAYNRATFRSERDEMLQKWADYLDDLTRHAA